MKPIFEIKPQDIELVVSQKTLGTLVTNALQIKDIVSKGVDAYNISNYNETNIDAAKKDKATLNSAAKQLNDKRIEFEREFMLPFAEFKEVVTDTVKLIKDCSAKIDEVVQLSDKKAKDAKRAEIDKIFASLNFNLLTFDQLFDDKWLNKTVTLKTVTQELSAKIDSIKSDIAMIDAMLELGLTAEEVVVTKAQYIRTLDLRSAMDSAAELKRNRLRVEERAQQMQTNEVVVSVAEPGQSIKVISHINTAVQVEPLTRSFKVIATRELIVALGDFMNANNIYFEKI